MSIAHVIGRFQPFHKGHKALIDTALRVADQVLIVLGDTGCAPDHRDPWSVAERAQMIRACYPDAAHRLIFASVLDIPYDDEAWAKQVRHVVRSPLRTDAAYLVGYRKDASSFYLDLFPDWKFVPADLADDAGHMSATDVRRLVYRASWHGVHELVPQPVYDIVSAIDRDRRKALAAEYFATEDALAEWACPASQKYGYIATAVDAVVHTSSHLLLIERGGDIGRGTLALPGGFVDPAERLHVAALRELFEETGLDLRGTADHYTRPGSVVSFDAVKRSARGRVITHALSISLADSWVDYAVSAGDDARTAMWVPKAHLASLPVRRRFFSDHWHIANHFVN